MSARLPHGMPPLKEQDVERRRQYLAATFVTCVVLSLVGGTIHVLELGSNRMHQIRDKASYDLADQESRLRGAGEDNLRHIAHEQRRLAISTYSEAEAQALLAPEQWQALEVMIEIPAGEFIIGTDNLRADPQDHPQRKVSLPAYKIDKYPVTNAQYARFLAATGHRPPLHWSKGKIPSGLAMHPVTMVSWFDAKKYAEWAGKRLPTETEWERAARGVDGRRWPWGNKMDPAVVNTYYRVGTTTPVDALPGGASPEGVFDMAGNVSQWVADDFLPYPGSQAPESMFRAKAPKLPESGSERAMKVVDFVETDERYKVLRGGSWKSDPFSTASYHRNFSWPHFASDFFGFRCAQDVNS